MSLYSNARLKEEMDEVVKSYFPGPDRWQETLSAIHQFDKAHIVMLSEENLVPKDAAIAILKELKKMEQIGVEKIRLETGEGLHSGEAFLTDRLGQQIAGVLHTGRSTPTLAGVATRITLRDKLLVIMSEIITLRKALLTSAGENLNTVMPSYTHLQHARVYTLAHYFLSWTYPLMRDFQRFKEIYCRTNISAAGAMGSAGSDFPLNLERVAEILGFDQVYDNARDIMFNLDYVLETFSAIAILNVNMARLAEDLSIWSSYEFNMVELADRYCMTSSISAQKKNPLGVEAVRGESSLIIGRMMGAFVLQKSPSDQIEPIFMMPFELWKTTEECLRVLRLMTGIISTLEIHKDVMRKLATEGWVQAPDLVNVIVHEKGIALRTAHQIVALLVRKAIEEGKNSCDALTSEEIDKIAKEYIGKSLGISDEVIQKVMDVQQSVNAREAAPEKVKERIEQCYESVRQDMQVLEICKSKLAVANEKLERAVEAILNMGGGNSNV